MVNSRSSWGIVLHCQAGACRAILHATPSHSSPSQYTNTNTNTNTNSLLALLHYIHCLHCLHCFHCSHWLHCLNCLRCSTLLILLTLLSLITLNSLFSLLDNPHMYCIYSCVVLFPTLSMLRRSYSKRSRRAGSIKRSLARSHLLAPRPIN